LQCSV